MIKEVSVRVVSLWLFKTLEETLCEKTTILSLGYTFTRYIFNKL